VLSSVGEHARSLALLGEAEARARQLGDRARLGNALSRMVTVRIIVGDGEGALEAGQDALELAARLGDPALHVHASYRLGQAYVSIGDYRRAAEVLRGNVAALARSTPGDVRLWCIKSQAWLAEVLSVLGEFAEGRRHGEEALRLAMIDGQRDALITARAPRLPIPRPGGPGSGHPGVRGGPGPLSHLRQPWPAMGNRWGPG
jgi:tetratricopeptide (TPR) repeat protein